MIADNDNKKVNILDEALSRFFDAYVRGEQPDIDKLVENYPLHEGEIRRRVRSLYEIDALFDSIVQADVSDFEEGTDRDLVGKRVGNFEIREMIGRGGMGVVYLANDTKLKRLVAIKSIPTKLAANPKAKMRFRREAELLASLNHPSIAVIHDIIEEEKSTYLVLEYIEGETLSKRIAREPLTVEQALSIGRQIAEAVSAAHKKGIVHSDLKPGNIKITPDGQVKVLDFGLAKPFTVDDGHTQTTSNQHRRIMGTPAYMSPEQAQGQLTDHRTDIWSFGCIMFQMLTSHLPFEGETVTDTLAHINEREPDWNLMSMEIPENVRVLLHHCLEKDPDKRLADMTDITLQLSDTLNKSSIVTVSSVSSKLKKVAMIVGTIVIIILTALGTRFILNMPGDVSPRNIRLAVLPFDSINPAGEVWFADGIADEIRMRLGYIHGLDIIANFSSIEYMKSSISPQIIKDDVDYFLEGTVQCEQPSDPNSQVRIMIHMVKTSANTRVWQDTFDGSIGDIIQLQINIAEEVARALDIKLLEPVRKALTYVYTDDPDAYWFLLQGHKNFMLGTKEGTAKAIEFYEKATTLDPNFALAYSNLSNALMEMYWLHGKNPDLPPDARKYAEKAIELDPNLPGAHVSFGRYYYQGCLDYENALEQFDIALKSYPNHIWAIRFKASAKRLQGNFNDAFESFLIASKLDPLRASFIADLGVTCRFMRRFVESEYYYKKAIELAPDDRGYYRGLAWAYLEWRGDINQAKEILENMKERTGDDKTFYIEVLLDIYEEEYSEALKKLAKLGDYENIAMCVPEVLRRAEIYGYMAREALEQQDDPNAEKYTNQKQKSYQDAVEILEKKVNEYPNDARYQSALGIACAGVGRVQDAIKHGKLGVDCLPMEKNMIQGPIRIEELARIYVMVGEYDNAINQIEILLEETEYTTEYTSELFEIDPAWDLLREIPRFQKLMEEEK